MSYEAMIARAAAAVREQEQKRANERALSRIASVVRRADPELDRYDTEETRDYLAQAGWYP